MENNNGKIIQTLGYLAILAGLILYGVASYMEKKAEKARHNSNSNSYEQSNTINWTEQNRIESEKVHNQLISTFENKVQSLGYTKVSSISVGDLNGNYATLHCPVKKGGSKVYSLVIFFKKYTDFEIIKVELWDEGNMTKMQLE